MANIVTIYERIGMIDNFNVTKAIFSMLLILLAFALLRKTDMPSFFYLHFIMAVTVIPSLVLFSGSDLSFSFAFISWVAFLIVACVGQMSRVSRIRAYHIKTKVLLFCCVVLSLVFIASIFAFGGSQFINFNLSRVYELREEAVQNLPYIYSYLLPNFSKVIIPIGIVLCLVARQYLGLLILIFCNVMIFALSTHKTPLFIPFVIILAYWLFKYPQKVKITLSFFCAGVFISGLIYFLVPLGLDEIWLWISALFLYRSILLPCWLNWQHFEFFSNNPYYYWADSKLSLGLVTSPYDLPMPYLVSREYVGIDQMGSANTGWIGSGMGNAGYLGIILYSLLFGLFLSLIDAYAKKLGKSIVFAIFLIPVITVATSIDFTTMLLTQGLLILMFLIMLMEPTKQSKAVATYCK
jgi:oligosaccharide repeat unit polymerase